MKSKLATLSTICSAAMVAVFFAPSVHANTSARIDGNGAFSDNSIHISSNNTTRISQDNTANINNTVNANANTGGNSSGFNTGGDTRSDTGDAQTNVRIDNDVNKNVLSVDGCGCNNNDTHLSITGNGAFSENKIHADQNKTLDIDQNNDAHIDNHVNANTNTGDNNSSGSDWNNRSKDYDHPNYDKKDKYDGNKYDSNRMKKPYNNYFSKKDDHKYLPLVKYDNHKNYDRPNYKKDLGNRKYSSMYSPWMNDWWKLSGNTGGDTAIRTGNADSNVWISNSANANFLSL